MKAYYYSIRHKTSRDIVDEGIITDAEDNIYPRQKTGIKELPSECEAHHFKSDNYELVGWYFDIPFEALLNYRKE